MYNGCLLNKGSKTFCTEDDQRVKTVKNYIPALPR